jgi:hypothetical protein
MTSRGQPAGLLKFRFASFERLVWVLACLLTSQQGRSAGASLTVPEAGVTRSFSGQFITHPARASELVRIPPNLSTNKALLRLDPTLMTVSCERIKQLLMRELGSTAPWQGRIHLILRPTTTSGTPIALGAERFKDGWQYALQLPDPVEKYSFVRAIVDVLLLEVANRQATERSAEVPGWLTDGLTQQLLAANGNEILLPFPRSGSIGLSVGYTSVSAAKMDPLREAHEVLSRGTPLSFDQLSWPANELDSAEEVQVYRSSAQLFVNELLRLKDGPPALLAMLQELPAHYNWQFAFLKAFRQHFQRPLDTEKWWALRVVHFTGRQLTQTWSVEESCEKLDQALHATVQLRAGTNELPIEAGVTLQRIVREWERPRQVQALKMKLTELELLRLRVAQDVVALVDGYSRTINVYLQNTEKPGVLPFWRNAGLARAVEEATKQLDVLDGRRARVAPVATPIISAKK